MKKLLFKLMYNRKTINTSRRITLGFAGIILAGAVLLTLPISSRTGEITPFFTSLFTATSASCVTGLVLVDTYTHWSFFGQLVIITLIQTGGLGFMSIVTGAFLAGNKKIGMRNRLMLRDSFGMDSMEGVVSLMKMVLKTVFIIELAGAVILSFIFIPAYGPARGARFSIFHSISAFCNAGFDLIGIDKPDSSMMLYNTNYIVLITLASLITIGGLGFCVWRDIFNRIKLKKRLSTYTKAVLIMTLIILVAGTALIFIFESQNPETMGGMSLPHKILNSFFQTATTRTAGFDAIGQANMTDSAKAVSILTMLIGGSAGSTAGGIKTVTAAVIILSAINAFRGRNSLNLFGRSIPQSRILYASAILSIAIILLFIGSVITSALDGVTVLDALFEYVSAYATVGLTAGVTAEGGMITRSLLILYMFFGRVGIMTIGVSVLTKNNSEDRIKYPKASILIG